MPQRPEVSFREPERADSTLILEIAQATGLFQTDELKEFDALLAPYFDGALGPAHIWVVAEVDHKIIGAAYYALEAMSDAVWNLLFIGVSPARHGQGLGTAILAHLEDDLRDRGARLLLVETSGVTSFDGTRRFYTGAGFAEEARVRDYYGAGDDKVIFRKDLMSPG